MSNVEIDPATGFPKVADGYYWAIDEVPGFAVLLWRVKLMKRRRFLWDKRVDFEKFYSPADYRRANRQKNLGWSSFEEYMHHYVIRVFERTHSDDVVNAEYRKKYVGQYPPKNLESA